MQPGAFGELSFTVVPSVTIRSENFELLSRTDGEIPGRVTFAIPFRACFPFTPRMSRLVAPVVLFMLGTLLSRAADSRPNILFCLADDWSWPHAGAYGDKVARTPTFDRVAREGMRFNFCFSAAPSCTPSRAAILTGQYPHRLEEGSCLWGFLPKKFQVYPDLLEKAGYKVGCTRKGWGPGNFRDGGFTRNPAGPEFKDFQDFSKPFRKEHRSVSGLAAGIHTGRTSGVRELRMVLKRTI